MTTTNTPELHIGDSAFESWYSTYSPAHKSDKQRARDAYAAGMGDPLVTAAPAAVPGPSGYGPKVTVKRRCSDCKACNSESYAVQGDSGHYVYCEHPSLPERKYIGDTYWDTPDWCPAAAPTTQPAPQQPGVGNSGFDHKTAADFLNGKTVSDEAMRKFVAASRWAHDDRAGLQAKLLSVRNELAARESEIALLKTELMDAGGRVYAFRRKGLADFCTCDEARYEELSNKPHLFETRIFYTAPQPSPAAQEDALDAAYAALPEPALSDDLYCADMMRAFADATCAIRASHGQAPAVEYLRTQITGMSVSVDVSTDDATAGHRYFGTVTEVMGCQGDKHGITLLVQDAEPNFKAQPAPAAVAGCTRSHPHENMDSACRAKAAIAEMRNKAARGAEATAHDLDRFVVMLTSAPTTQPAPQQEVQAGSAQGDALDAERLDWLRENSCDLRCVDSQTGQGDGDIHWVVIEHHMAEPVEREIGRAYRDDPRAAIDAARAAQEGK